MSRERNGIGTGIVLITIGLIFLADRQGYGGFGNFWPLILIVMGASKLFFRDDSSLEAGVVVGRRGCRRENRFGGLWLIMVGVIFLLHQNHIWSIRETWPLFIVAGGLGIVFSGIFNRKHADSNPGDQTIGGGGQLS